MIMKGVLPEADGLGLPFRVASGAGFVGLVRPVGVIANIFAGALPGGPGVEFMIVNSFGHIAPQTAHDHGIAIRGASLPEG